MYTLDEVRNIFLNFFKKNNHTILNSSSVISKNKDLFFTNSGMNQFKNYILGIDKIKYNKIATSQKCIRVGGKNSDLHQVGYTSFHNTFFEMLGNFSFDNYFKEECIYLALKLLIGSNYFNISKKKLLITVHSMDYDSYNIWIKLGINKNNIIKIGSNSNYLLSDNFWRMSEVDGPCGLCTEIFYINDNKIELNKNFKKNCTEIWNLVFMQFNYVKSKNKLYNLPFKSVDTGMGLERISSILQNVKSNYDIDIFKKIIEIILKKINKNIKLNINIKIISDHIRSIIFIINEGVIPSNSNKGYILRKIIRRSICSMILLGIKNNFLYNLVDDVIEVMSFYKFEFKNNIEYIKNIIYKEESKFFKTLNIGLNILNRKILNNNFIDGDFLFKLHDTYGLPIYLSTNILKKNKINFDIKKFKKLMSIQKKFN